MNHSGLTPIIVTVSAAIIVVGGGLWMLPGFVQDANDGEITISNFPDVMGVILLIAVSTLLILIVIVRLW